MPHPLIIETLLAVAVVSAWLSTLGLVLMRDYYERLHYMAPAATIAAMAIAAAVVLREGLDQAGVKAILIALTLGLINPVLSHATARAGRIRHFRRWLIRAAEKRPQGAPTETQGSGE